MRLPQIALVVALAIAAVQIAYYYPQLPDIMASHFDFSGAPNSWQPKAVFFGLFSFIYVFFTIMFWSLPHLILVTPPSLINVPNKDYWLAPERREITAHLIGDHLLWLGAFVIGFLILVCQLAIVADLPGRSAGLGSEVWWLTGIFAAITIVWTIRFVRMFRVPAT